VLVEAPAVDGMNDDRRAGKPGGDAPEDSSLGAVRVDDEVPALADLTIEFVERDQVIDRADFTEKLWEDGEIDAAVSDFLNEGAFTAGLGSGDDVDFEARGVEEGCGEHGVFLRTADDEPGDEVEDGDGWH